jgi:hypothetical protein
MSAVCSPVETLGPNPATAMVEDQGAARLGPVKKPCTVPSSIKDDSMSVFQIFSATCHYCGQQAVPDKLINVVVRFASMTAYLTVRHQKTDSTIVNAFNKSLPTGWHIKSDVREAWLVSRNTALETGFTSV